MRMSKRMTNTRETSLDNGAEQNGHIGPAVQPTMRCNATQRLRDICDDANRLANHIDRDWFGVRANVGVEICELTSEDLTTTLQTQLSDAHASLESLAVSAATAAAVLDAVREAVRNRVEDYCKQREIAERLRSAYVGN